MPISEAMLIDNMEYMKTVPDKFFDLAVVDPQFGIGNFVQTTGNVRGEKVNWNQKPPDESYFFELRRVSKHRVIFGANYFNCFDGKKGALIWIKNQPMPDFSKAVIASCSFHQKVEIYEKTWTNFVNDKTGIHPCEMPISIYKWILETYAKFGNKIFDSHMGSQSSRIAAYQMGFDYWGCEIDPQYFADGCKRFNLVTSQQQIQFK